MNDKQEFVIREFENAHSTLAISDYGAHVLSWTPRGQRSVIWRPQAISLQSGVAIRGGIPIVAPWFGAGYSNGISFNLSPKHGIARISRWQYCGCKQDSALSRVCYEYECVNADAAHTPLHMQYSITFGQELKVMLKVCNVGRTQTRCECALHSYIQVSDITDIAIYGLDGASYWDVISGDMNCTQKGDLVLTGATDRIYDAANSVDVRDKGFGRVLRITAEGSEQTVIWNPWAEGARAISDLDPCDWKRFLCIEAAACRDRAIILDPGEEWVLGQTIAL